MKALWTLIVTSIFCFTYSQDAAQTLQFSSVEVDTILVGDYTIRALIIDGGSLHYGADKSRVGTIQLHVHWHGRPATYRETPELRKWL